MHWFPASATMRQNGLLKEPPDFSHGPERNRFVVHSRHLDLVQKFPGRVFTRGPEDKKQVALTFDDGPDGRYTPWIADLLQHYKVHATFFLVGNLIPFYPHIVKQLLDDGHIVGNHTWSHANLTKITPQMRRMEVGRAEQMIQSVIGYRPTLFRPPYGAINEEVVRELVQWDYFIILWDVDSLDWSGLSSPQIVANVLAHVKNGSIVLMHSAGGKEDDRGPTLHALPYIIDVLREEGFTFVTVPELLGIPASR